MTDIFIPAPQAVGHLIENWDSKDYLITTLFVWYSCNFEILKTWIWTFYQNIIHILK